jgi:hypothetical protein
MPRLSLYRPQKGNDYKFIDKNIWEMFQVGGTDVLVHRYLGPNTEGSEGTPSQPIYNNDSVLNIQDLLLLENRDRKYDPDVYILRGVYNLSDIDFNLSQFGLFLQNDTIFITFHINDTVEKLGRKIIAGDVLELPHLKDEYALNDFSYALRRFYVVEEVNRAAEGFSVTWYPHLYRAKCKPLVDSQEFKQILDDIANRDALVGNWNPNASYEPGDIVIGADGKKYEVVVAVTGVEPPNTTYYKLADTLREIVSTYEKEMQITKAVLDQAEADAPKSGYDTSMYYTMTTDEEGNPAIITVDLEDIDASVQKQATDENGNLLFDIDGNPIFVVATADTLYHSAQKSGYEGYLLGDGIPPNGAPYTAAIAFPVNPVIGQFCLRKDFKPSRLFRYDGRRWVKVEDNVRTSMSKLGPSDTAAGKRYEGKDIPDTQLSGFVNNVNTARINNQTVKEKQSLSKALRPEADE